MKIWASYLQQTPEDKKTNHFGHICTENGSKRRHRTAYCGTVGNNNGRVYVSLFILLQTPSQVIFENSHIYSDGEMLQ